MAFDKQRALIRLQGKAYLPVAARLVWFREQHPDWGIQTEIVEINHEKQFAVFRATVRDAEGRTISTATKKEDAKGFGDYIEKAETGSVGRALGMAGFGTDSDPDMDDGKNGDAAHIVDSPQASRAPVTTPSARFTDSRTADNRTADSRPAYAPRPQAPRPAASIEADPFSDS